MNPMKDCAGKTILILGAGTMQMPALTLARQMGLRVLAVDGSASAPGVPLADEFAPIDLKDEAAILSWARSREMKPDGVFTAGTDFSAAVARLARDLGLPGMPVETAMRASDKALMREAFARAGVPSPRFARVCGLGAAQEAASALGFPLVVKPVDSMGARGCRRVDSDDELAEAVADALSHSRSGSSIVEEFIDGPEYSVDAIVRRGRITICGLADRHIRFPPFFIEMGHTMPTEASDGQKAEILRVFSAGVAALGIRDGAAKGDIKLGPDGKARVGEIAARLSGGYMSGWTYPRSSGVSVTAAAIRVALDLDPGDLEPTLSLVAAERAWISIPGRVAEIRGLEDARAVDGVTDVFPRSQAGDSVDFPRNNVQKCGNVIAVSADRAAAIAVAEAAARKVLIRLEAADPRTGQFLFDGHSWPPPAFPVDPLFHEALRAMPDRVSGPDPDDGAGILPPPLPLKADQRDWQGRTMAEALAAALSLSGARVGRGRVLLGKEFWSPFLVGGYQGGAWALDRAEADR